MGIEVKLEDEQVAEESGLRVNLDSDGTAPPEGVYTNEEDIPPERVELFRVNGRIYTLLRRVDPRVVFRMIRDVHRGGGMSDIAQANLLYEVLGEAVIDFLADEELDDDELDQVMKAVQKHTMKAAKKLLGN